MLKMDSNPFKTVSWLLTALPGDIINMMCLLGNSIAATEDELQG